MAHAELIPAGAQPFQIDLSLQGRYRTIWPALMTRVAWQASANAVRNCTLGRAPWLRATTGTILGGLLVLFIVAGWAALACLIPLWPLGWLLMLPTRIAVKRDVPNQTMIYALCWISLPLITFPVWWVALILAFRDPRHVAA